MHVLVAGIQWRLRRRPARRSRAVTFARGTSRVMELACSNLVRKPSSMIDPDDDPNYSSETPASAWSHELDAPEPRNPQLDQYVGLVSHLLMRFQWIEEFLKTYILAAHQLIAVRTLGIMGYAYDAKAIRAMPLGPLIKLYARLGGDPAIVARLNGLPDERNKIAHASFLIWFNKSGQVDNFDQRLIELTELNERIKGLPFAINQDYRALTKRLKDVNTP